MLKKTITFDDLDGNPVTKDFYFHMTKADIAETELSKKGGLEHWMRQMVAAEDGPSIIAAFKEILAGSVGKRSEDNIRFIKTPDIRDEFLQSDAYSVLFMELIEGGADKMAEFVKGVVPAGLGEAIEKKQAEMQTVELPSGETDKPDYDDLLETHDWEPTPEDIRKMTPEQMQKAYLRKTSR